MMAVQKQNNQVSLVTTPGVRLIDGCRINWKKLKFLFDTGEDTSLIREQIWENISRHQDAI